MSWRARRMRIARRVSISLFFFFSPSSVCHFFLELSKHARPGPADSRCWSMPSSQQRKTSHAGRGRFVWCRRIGRSSGFGQQSGHASYTEGCPRTRPTELEVLQLCQFRIASLAVKGGGGRESRIVPSSTRFWQCILITDISLI